MLYDLMKKYNLDLKCIKIEDVLSILLFLISLIFFKVDIALLSSPILLGTFMLLRENFKINPIKKFLYPLCLYIFIITLSFLSSINIIFGIFINFLSLFILSYKFYLSNYHLLYKPLLMLYIFTYIFKVDFRGFFERCLFIAFILTLILILNFLFENLSYISLIKNNIAKILLYLEENSLNILNNKPKNHIKISINYSLKTLCYNLYIKEREDTNNIYFIQFKIYIILDNLNIQLDNLNKLYKTLNHKSSLIESFLRDFKKNLSLSRLYLKGRLSYNTLEKELLKLNKYHTNLPEQLSLFHDLSISLQNLYLDLSNLMTLEEGEFIKSYKFFKNINKNPLEIRDFLNSKKLKLSFSLKLSLIFTLLLSFFSILNFIYTSFMSKYIFSLNYNPLYFFKIFYLCLFIFIYFFGDKFFFSQTLNKDIRKFILKILRNFYRLGDSLIKSSPLKEEEILILNINIRLMCNKLSLINFNKNSKEIENLIYLVESLSSSLSYYILFKKDLGLVCSLDKSELLKFKNKLYYLLEKENTLKDIINLLHITLDSLINCSYYRKVNYNKLYNGLIYL